MRDLKWLPVAALGALSTALSCQKVLGFEEFQGGAGAAAPTGGAAGGAAAGAGGGSGAASTCVGGAAPATGSSMAAVKGPDGKCFWIDTTEVTKEQYAEFLKNQDGGAPIPTRPSGC